ncbi:MAG: XdhC family protein [Tepidisphaeraceae bacterium]
MSVIPKKGDAELWRAAREQLARGEQATIRIEVPTTTGEAFTFDHILHPTPTLLVAGAGHIAAALASMAPSIDFDTTVIDDRADHASAARFPSARCIVGDIESELRRFPITPNTYIVIVTRGHRHDAAALGAVIQSPAKYVGLIGSKRKVLTILRGLRDAGVPVDLLRRVHAPIGLNLGAITPGEIAVSIAAELVAVRRGVATDAVRSMRFPLPLGEGEPSNSVNP